LDVPLPVPLIDNRDYAELRKELITRIPVHNPEWTTFNQSDAGVTLVQLFAFLADSLLAYLEDAHARRRRRRRRALLLAGVSGAAFALWWVRRDSNG
jgi:hypothetical protein